MRKEGETKNKDIIAKIREDVTKDIEDVTEDIEQHGSRDKSDTVFLHKVTDSYLLLQILDKLGSIDEKLDMLNGNVIDVETEVSKINADHKG
jgi:hypothetical protein